MFGFRGNTRRCFANYSLWASGNASWCTTSCIVGSCFLSSHSFHHRLLTATLPAPDDTWNRRLHWIPFTQANNIPERSFFARCWLSHFASNFLWTFIGPIEANWTAATVCGVLSLCRSAKQFIQAALQLHWNWPRGLQRSFLLQPRLQQRHHQIRPEAQIRRCLDHSARFPAGGASPPSPVWGKSPPLFTKATATHPGQSWEKWNVRHTRDSLSLHSEGKKNTHSSHERVQGGKIAEKRFLLCSASHHVRSCSLSVFLLFCTEIWNRKSLVVPLEEHSQSVYADDGVLLAKQRAR